MTLQTDDAVNNSAANNAHFEVWSSNNWMPSLCLRHFSGHKFARLCSRASVKPALKQNDHESHFRRIWVKWLSLKFQFRCKVDKGTHLNKCPDELQPLWISFFYELFNLVFAIIWKEEKLEFNETGRTTAPLQRLEMCKEMKQKWKLGKPISWTTVNYMSPNFSIVGRVTVNHR